MVTVAYEADLGCQESQISDGGGNQDLKEALGPLMIDHAPS